MWLGSTTSPARLTRERRKPIRRHDPRQGGTVLDTLSPLQIHRFQKGRHPKCDRKGLPLATRTLPARSLRSPLLPVPMAGFRRGDGISGSGDIPAPTASGETRVPADAPEPAVERDRICRRSTNPAVPSLLRGGLGRGCAPPYGPRHRGRLWPAPRRPV